MPRRRLIPAAVLRLMDPVPSVRRLRPTVPAGIDRVLQQALAAAPADRFASAIAFADALAAPGPDSKAPVVAVLPFRNLSPDPENEFFADGITEDVITHLSKVRTLDVISRASVMPFKHREQTVQEIGAALHAGTLLDGSVRRAGNRVRIVAQLVDARTGQHLWAESYDRELTDIFEIQTDVALHIAAALRAELSPEEQVRIRHEPTSDIEAYQLYVQGRHCALRASREGLFQAVDYFEQATKADPGYAEAWAGIALALVELGETGFLSSEAGYPRAREAVLTALRLDPRLADGHCALAQLKAVWEFDWIGAEAAFKRALALQPGYAPAYDLYGRLCTDLQRYEEALALQRRARELDPLSNRADMATALLRAGRYQEAEAAAAAMERVDPGYARIHATLGWARFKAGRMAEGIAGLERAVALAPDGVQWLAQLGQALALAGQPERARQILARLDAMAAETFVSPYHLAHVYTGLGEFDAAMDLLEQAFQERSAGIHGIKGSFLFAPLRDHPRFVALLRRMNLA